jgi:hypothetical protein
MVAPDTRLLNAYLEARFAVTRHPDDPTPVLTEWTAQRALELLLIRRGWSDLDLDTAFAQYERSQLRSLNVDGWRSHLAEALARSTARSTRIAQALARYRELASGPAD